MLVDKNMMNIISFLTHFSLTKHDKGKQHRLKLGKYKCDKIYTATKYIYNIISLLSTVEYVTKEENKHQYSIHKAKRRVPFTYFTVS